MFTMQKLIWFHKFYLSDMLVWFPVYCLPSKSHILHSSSAVIQSHGLLIIIHFSWASLWVNLLFYRADSFWYYQQFQVAFEIVLKLINFHRKTEIMFCIVKYIERYFCVIYAVYMWVVTAVALVKRCAYMLAIWVVKLTLTALSQS